jgi:N5-(cytidine 5'-diphosphoramidyl)-L-glutamine hydrolase
MMHDQQVRRMGLTMRCTIAQDYEEPRDALAWDWADFMATVLPEAGWLPIPSLGSAVAEYALRWRLDGFILTGGEDLGIIPQRDRTEYALLDYALKQDLPILGICRGLQVLQTFLRGRLTPCAGNIHRGKRHEILFSAEAMSIGIQPGRAEVNSYHQWGIRSEDMAGSLVGFAYDGNGWVEAALGRSVKMLGTMWHPEREEPLQSFDIHMVRRFFGMSCTD